MYYKDLLEELNKQQVEAVTNSDKRVCVLAGPGCGKTKTLVSKVIYLIDIKLIDPSTILLWTFSKKAIEEIRERLKKIFSYEIVNKIKIYNFHSFCYNFLNYYYRKSKKNNFIIYDQKDQEEIIRIISEKLEESLENKEIKNIVSFISLWKCESSIIEKIYQNEFKKMKRYFDLYQSYLEEKNGLDFNDLIIKTIEIIENKQADQILKKISWILIDEFQDVNAVQFKLAKKIETIFKDCSIFLVGDPNQSIYGFQGANFEIINLIVKDEKWRKIYLNVNYRSSIEVLKISNSFLEKNQGALIYNKLLPFKEKNGGVHFFQRDGLYPLLINLIEKLIDEERINPKDILIIYRSNYLSNYVQKVMINSNKKYKVLGAFKFLDREEIKDLISILKFIIYRDDVSFIRLTKIIEGLGDSSIKKIEENSWKKNTNIYNYLISLNIEEFSFIRTSLARRNIINFISGVKNISKIFENNMLDLKTSINNLINEIDYIEHLKRKKKDYETRISNIESFIILAESWEKNNSSEEIFNFTKDKISKFIQHLLISIEDKSDYNNDYITISSVHQAKGLEFEAVIFVYLNKGIIPIEKTYDINEEKRIFYVGITRSKKYLFLLSGKGETSSFVKDIYKI